jgi:hypothetical protein
VCSHRTNTQVMNCFLLDLQSVQVLQSHDVNSFPKPSVMFARSTKSSKCISISSTGDVFISHHAPGLPASRCHPHCDGDGLLVWLEEYIHRLEGGTYAIKPFDSTDYSRSRFMQVFQMISLFPATVEGGCSVAVTNVQGCTDSGMMF